MEGAADVAETQYTPFQHEPDAVPVRLIVRRVKPTPGSQLVLFATYSHHAFITDRDGDTLDWRPTQSDDGVRATPRSRMPSAISSTAWGSTISPRDASPPILSLPKGAWLTVQVMAHNLARWTGRIGMGEQLATTKTLRRRFFSLAGRLTRKARRFILHLPPGLALAKPVQQRPRPIARPATPHPDRALSL